MVRKEFFIKYFLISLLWGEDSIRVITTKLKTLFLWFSTWNQKTSKINLPEKILFEVLFILKLGWCAIGLG